MTGSLTLAILVVIGLLALLAGTIRILRELMADRMYPLTLAGLDDAMRELTRKR